MLLEVRDNENIPADLLCLHCSHADNVCFIKTVNLDGKPQEPKVAYCVEMSISAKERSFPAPQRHFPLISVEYDFFCCYAYELHGSVLSHAEHSPWHTLRLCTWQVYLMSPARSLVHHLGKRQKYCTCTSKLICLRQARAI